MKSFDQIVNENYLARTLRFIGEPGFIRNGEKEVCHGYAGGDLVVERENSIVEFGVYNGQRFLKRIHKF